MTGANRASGLSEAGVKHDGSIIQEQRSSMTDPRRGSARRTSAGKRASVRRVSSILGHGEDYAEAEELPLQVEQKTMKYLKFAGKL